MWAQKGILAMIFRVGILWMSGWFAQVQAVEFGEITVVSFAGQPLAAEVELTALSAEESSALQVKLAGRDVYRGANIRFNPVLSGLRWSIQQRDRRMFIRLSTERPVNAPYLNMFFEMGTKTDHAVRALTVWLESDPNANPVAEDLIESREVPEQGRTVFQPEMAELPGVKLNRLTDSRQNKSSRGNRNNSHCSVPRCIAAERENRIITAHIVELEKSVEVLRNAMVPLPPVADKPEPEASATSEPVSPGELFLKKEEPLLPKPVHVAKAIPWLKIALAGAGLLVFASVLGYWLYSKRKKKSKPKLPVAKPLPKSVKNPRWQRWSDMLRNFPNKWRKTSAKETAGSSDNQADGAEEQSGVQAMQMDAIVDDVPADQAKAAGKMSKLSQRLSRFVSRLALPLVLLRQKIGQSGLLVQGLWGKPGKKSGSSATPKAGSEA